jgi:hypothetical protein
MALAARLAHLVGGTISGVGRRAQDAFANRRWLTPPVLVAAFLLLVLSVGFVFGLGGSAAPLGHRGSTQQGQRAAGRHHGRPGSDRPDDDSGNAVLAELGASGSAVLPAATGAPAPASAAVADQPTLAARENFAFAPYWTLGQAPTFDITGLSTIAYFSIGVNPDGSLDESGAGWSGFESQDLVDLISRAHAAGERVVLTVNDFGQSSLEALTSSPTAAETLAAALIPLLQAKSLDGVNFDFEGDGSADQTGLTNLIAAVSTALRNADPHWQITMDTYASSAGDPGGFYDIPALAQFVDAFFVMDYELNLAGSPTAASPLTSGAFSSLTTLEQYAKAVPVSKVILGLPFFGIDWPTTNGTLAANAAGPAADIADSEAQGNGPQYWDPVTGTAWTSYLVGSQWHESYYEGEYGLYQAAQAATKAGARGVGIWALGMENDGAQMIASMDGIDPGQPASTGPASTSASPSATPTVPPPTATASSGSGSGSGGGGGGGTGGPSSPTSTPTSTSTLPPTTAPPPTTTTTTLPPYASGSFDGTTVSLTPVAASEVTPFTGDGSLTGFSTNEPAYACLNGATIAVYWDGLLSSQLVAVAVTPTNCMSQDFLLPSSA